MSGDEVPSGSDQAGRGEPDRTAGWPRASGVLLPVSALPEGHGIGDLGPSARAFVDFLSAAGQSAWQILPLAPTSPISGNSPYSGLSAFAIDPVFISLDDLVEEGLLTGRDVGKGTRRKTSASYRTARRRKMKLTGLAARRFSDLPSLETFASENRSWVQDWARFAALSREKKVSWAEWSAGERERTPEALELIDDRLSEAIRVEIFAQYVAHSQWAELRAYARERDVRIIGDLPLYMAHGSADVWSRQELFELDAEGWPTSVSGVPPDDFSETGQLWGHPLFEWEAHRRSEYAWWLERVARNLELFDAVRIDHFRGLERFWSVPAEADTAEEGEWVEGPGSALLDRIGERWPDRRLLAEDLGVITPEVRQLMRRHDLPGMKVLQFGFGEDFPASEHLPHRLNQHTVYYTGTHDNDTLMGWYGARAEKERRERVRRYVGKRLTRREAHEELLRLVMQSVASLVVLPMQDVLGLESKARLNIPGEAKGNWTWRLDARSLTPEAAAGLRGLTETFERVSA